MFKYAQVSVATVIVICTRVAVKAGFGAPAQARVAKAAAAFSVVQALLADREWRAADACPELTN